MRTQQKVRLIVHLWQMFWKCTTISFDYLTCGVHWAHSPIWQKGRLSLTAKKQHSWSSDGDLGLILPFIPLLPTGAEAEPSDPSPRAQMPEYSSSYWKSSWLRFLFFFNLSFESNWFYSGTHSCDICLSFIHSWSIFFIFYIEPDSPLQQPWWMVVLSLHEKFQCNLLCQLPSVESSYYYIAHEIKLPWTLYCPWQNRRRKILNLGRPTVWHMESNLVFLSLGFLICKMEPISYS
jgi:hypothetical protein